MDLFGTKLNNIGCVCVKKNKKIGKYLITDFNIM
jgi:hypothetical protein